VGRSLMEVRVGAWEKPVPQTHFGEIVPMVQLLAWVERLALGRAQAEMPEYRALQ
jgi:hypothetical protein